MASGEGIQLGRPELEEQTKDGFDLEEYALRKRLPRKLPKRKSDVYVNSKTSYKAQLARCQSLFDGGAQEIYIHGLGAAVNKAMNLALQLKSRSLDTLELSPNTSTVEVIDDLEPERDDLNPETQTRNVSAIHIKVYQSQGADERMSKSPISDNTGVTETTPQNSTQKKKKKRKR